MNLQQTISELEQKAAEYTQAADSLRVLLRYENTGGTSGSGRNGSTAGAKAEASTRGTAKKGAKEKAASPTVAGKQQGKRAPMSPETRAKLSASAKARHQKAQAG
jgi:cell division septum initiation protein DivIVA